MGKWDMAGTEGTYEYRVLVRAKYGRIGVRLLSDGRVRVRIEPIDDAAVSRLDEHFPAPKWKRPGDNDQIRYSRVFGPNEKDEAGKVIRRAIRALGPATSRRYNMRQLRSALGRL